MYHFNRSNCVSAHVRILQSPSLPCHRPSCSWPTTIYSARITEEEEIVGRRCFLCGGCCLLSSCGFVGENVTRTIAKVAPQIVLCMMSENWQQMYAKAKNKCGNGKTFDSTSISVLLLDIISLVIIQIFKPHDVCTKQSLDHIRLDQHDFVGLKEGNFRQNICSSIV
jgi:hypothetical protein